MSYGRLTGAQVAAIGLLVVGAMYDVLGGVLFSEYSYRCTLGTCMLIGACRRRGRQRLHICGDGRGLPQLRARPRAVRLPACHRLLRVATNMSPGLCTCHTDAAYCCRIWGKGGSRGWPERHGFLSGEARAVRLPGCRLPGTGWESGTNSQREAADRLFAYGAGIFATLQMPWHLGHIGLYMGVS